MVRAAEVLKNCDDENALCMGAKPPPILLSRNSKGAESPQEHPNLKAREGHASNVIVKKMPGERNMAFTSAYGVNWHSPVFMV